MLRKMEQSSMLDSSKKMCQAYRQIFTYVIISGRAKNNPVMVLISILKTPEQTHFPHLMADELGPFMNT
nr:hypothetical protein [Photorhabdus hindustanensis]